MFTAETTDIRSQYPPREFEKVQIRDNRSALCKNLKKKNGVKTEIENFQSKLMFPQFKLSSEFEGYVYIKILNSAGLSFMLDEYYTDRYCTRENKLIRQFVTELALETITGDFRTAHGIKVDELKCLSDLVRKIEDICGIWPQYIQEAVYYAAKSHIIGHNNPGTYYRSRREELDLWSKQNKGNYFIQKVAQLIQQDVNAVLLLLANIVSKDTRNSSPDNQYFDEVDGNYCSANLWGEGVMFPHYIDQLKLPSQFQNHILFENALQHGQKRSYEVFERDNCDPNDEEMFVPQSPIQDRLPQVEAETVEQNVTTVPSEFEVPKEALDCLTKLNELCEQINNTGRFDNWHGNKPFCEDPSVEAERRVLYYLFKSGVFEVGMEPAFSTDKALILSPHLKATMELETNPSEPGTTAEKINEDKIPTVGRFTADYFKKFGLHLKLCEDETFKFCKLESSGRKSMVFEFKEREITFVELFAKISTASKDGNATTSVRMSDRPPVTSLDLENPPTSQPATPSPVERQQSFKKLRTSTPNNQPSFNVSKSFTSLEPCLRENSLNQADPTPPQESYGPHKPQENAVEQRENSNMLKMSGKDPEKDSESTKEGHREAQAPSRKQQELSMPSNDSQKAPNKSKYVVNASKEQMKRHQASDAQIEEPQTAATEPNNAPSEPQVNIQDANGKPQSIKGPAQRSKMPVQGPTQAPTAITRRPKPAPQGPRVDSQPRKTAPPPLKNATELQGKPTKSKVNSKPSQKPSVASILGRGRPKQDSQASSVVAKNPVKDSQKPVPAAGVNGVSKDPKVVPEDLKNPKNRRLGPERKRK